LAAMWHRLGEVALSWPAMWHKLGETAHYLAATWHYGGAHLSDVLRQGRAHLLTWTNRRVPRGTAMLR
jgi:hypothetical protein